MSRGRPSKYEEIDLKKVEKLAGYGLTNDEIADFFGVVRSTFQLWMKDNTELSDALKAGKLKADKKVVKSLFKRAIGYSYDEIHWETVKTGRKKSKSSEDSEDIEFAEDEQIAEADQNLVITKKIRKEIVPDVTAQIFWLKNRRPDKWRDKQEVEHSGKIINQNFTPAPGCEPITE